jgi:SAM-dependent methyltransferase
MDRSVIAVEPSSRMIRQRATGMARVLQAAAEALPFPDDTFDAGLAVLTLHHWTDWRRGLDEMQRVSRRLVIFTFEPGALADFWLTAAYFPEIVERARVGCPAVTDVMRHLGTCTADRIAIPHDCADGFLAAYWRRPEAYLDPEVRAGISGLALLDVETVTRGVARLEADLESGRWEERFGQLRQADTLDVGYRLVVADRTVSRVTACR